MKAILVIDVQMTEDGKHICNSCPVWDEKGCCCKHAFMTGHKGCPLIPIEAYDTIREEMKKRMENPERYAKR